MPVKYDDDFVVRPGTKHQYTQEQIDEIVKSSEDFFHFCKHVTIIDPDGNEVCFGDVMWDFQREGLEHIINNRHFIGLWGRQVGKSSIVGIFALWYSIFNKNITIGIVSNKEKRAITLLKRMKKSYEKLPSWIKPGVVKWDEKTVTFENNTTILVSATTDDAFRGETIQCITGESKVCFINDNDEIYYTSIQKATSFDLHDGYLGSGKTLKSAIEKYGPENFKKQFINRHNNTSVLESPTCSKMQILTKDGFKKFDGFVSSGYSDSIIKLTLSNGEFIKCTKDHKILLNDGVFSEAGSLNETDILFNDIVVDKKEQLNEKEEVFDALNVRDTHSFRINKGVEVHNCLLCDELGFVHRNCLSGDNLVKIRDKTTGEVIDITLKNLYINNNSSKYEILTDSGWSDFDGIDKTGKKKCLNITLENDKSIKCTKEHEIYDLNVNKVLAKNLHVIDSLACGNKISSIKQEEKEEDVYDIINVSKKNRFLCNDILVGNSVEAFWSANYPTLSSSEKSRIIVISTPNGAFTFFHRLWANAEQGKNPFKPHKVKWNAVPWRDEKWKEDQLAVLGKIKFQQEHEVEFIGSTATIINAEVLKNMLLEVKEPNIIDLNNRFRVWEKPIKGKEYFLGADPSKGTGFHNAIFHVFKINSIEPLKAEQVAIFADNYTDVYEFSDIMNRASLYYNNAHIMVENNGEGSAVVNNIHWVWENENMVNSGVKEKDLGIRATKSTKTKAVLNMKKLIEDGNIIIYDEKTIEELSAFEDDDGKYKSEIEDDRVSALYWGLYITEMDVLEEEEEEGDKKKETKESDEEDNDIWGILSDVKIDNEHEEYMPFL